jgi:hypothetical protein
MGQLLQFIQGVLDAKQALTPMYLHTEEQGALGRPAQRIRRLAIA